MTAVAQLHGRAQDNALDTLLTMVSARAAHYGEDQQIDAETVEAMKAAGVYRALVPARFGGDEKSPADFLRLIEAISARDGSAGWVASFGVSHMYLASLPEATLTSLYADGPDVVFAGAIFPPQPAVAVDGGYRVSGRWPFGSGSPGASLIGVGIKVEGAAASGLPRMAVMPADKVRIAPNWDVMGLRGTGSHDLVVEDVFVPEAWTFVRGAPPTIDLPAYRYPSMALAAQVLAVVGLGVARAALDLMAQMAGKRASITGAPVMADRANVQVALAKGEGEWQATRAWFYDVTEQAYAKVLAGDTPSREEVTLIRMAATQAARTGADVTRLMFEQAGTAGIFNNHPFSRLLQDALVVNQHAFLNEATWQSAGKSLLGLDAPAGYP
ncbi:acyl-CoA dehydrogenase family protein [Novosphingobium rosa]|uniref:acyl-CoA dehydrogenase family protein n=1 Tax=Novosphingobium rosa TaxID=76978 RepID=UPI000833EB26|nr:acyl-CoA dehydrogenase family protein [Novosphingobium rosa]